MQSKPAKNEMELTGWSNRVFESISVCCLSWWTLSSAGLNHTLMLYD